MNKKLVIAVALVLIGVSALVMFNLPQPKATSEQVSILAVPPEAEVELGPPMPEKLMSVPEAPKPWYDVLAESIKEIASAMIALAGAIMALVEVIKAIKQKSKPTEQV